MRDRFDVVFYDARRPADAIHSGELVRLRREMERNSEKLDKFMESRDRVDISLKEYEELKRVNKDLLDRLRHAEAILNNIGINADVIPHIIPESVKWYSAESYDCGPMIRKRRFRIEFDMEEY